jgi:hypothetical protein
MEYGSQYESTFNVHPTLQGICTWFKETTDTSSYEENPIPDSNSNSLGIYVYIELYIFVCIYIRVYLSVYVYNPNQPYPIFSLVLPIVSHSVLILIRNENICKPHLTKHHHSISLSIRFHQQHSYTPPFKVSKLRSRRHKGPGKPGGNP